MYKAREASIPGEGHVTNTHMNVNTIQSCDCTRVVMEVMRPVYDQVIVLGQF